MARTRVFISSTYYDLRYIRSSLENFIESLRYEAILSEEGTIPYIPDVALDESCYKEIEFCDLFVLIIGGRYGSPSTTDKPNFNADFYHRFDSIIHREYDAADAKELPIYILVEKSVYSEYYTFKENMDNKTVKYAHVDSINVFYFIDKVLAKSIGNPVFPFEKYQEIESWLKEQWSGLFKNMLIKRNENVKISSLAKQVRSLEELNTTLKRYLEVVVEKVVPGDAVKIIKEEHDRIEENKLDLDLQLSAAIKDLIKYYKFDFPEAKKLFIDSQSINDIARALEAKLVPSGDIHWEKERTIERWKATPIFGAWWQSSTRSCSNGMDPTTPSTPSSTK